MKATKTVNWVYLITLIVSQCIGALLVSVVTDYLLRLVLFQLVLVMPTSVYLLNQKVSIGESIAFRKISFGTGALVFVFTLAIWPLLTLVNALSMLFSNYTITDTMSGVATETPFPLMFLCVAVVPAILEETVYRGVFFQEYRKVSPVSGAILSGLLFGLMHGNVNQFCYAFVLGGIFAMVIEATGSIVSSMIMHLTINGGSVILMYVLPYLQKMLETLQGTEETVLQETEVALTLPLVLQMYLLPAIIGTVVACVVYREIVTVCGRQEQVKQDLKQPEKGKHFVGMLSIPLYIAAAILIMNMILAEKGV